LNIKLVAKYCKLNNIPTIYIPHAGIPLLEEVVTKREFSYITVAGKYDIDFYLKRGTPRKDIFITGAPRYEKFYNTKVRELKTVRDMFNNRKFKIDSKSTILLTTSPYDPTSIEKIITSVVSSLKELNLVDNLIIKLHPAEDGIHHKNILKKMNVNVIIVKNYALVELIKSSSLLISAVSTTILEAMIIGTPAILLEFINLGFKYIHINPFNQEKFVKAAKTQNELTFLIDQLIKNPPLRIEYSSELKRNSELFSFYDEKLPPTEKIVNLIFMIIS
jgi:UDP-N-acetylglucosamine:LPS N-acetylglucosamine transferase